MQAYRIILADDHVLFRQGMKRLIDEEKGIEVVGEANDIPELFNKVKELKPDMVLLDITMPDIGGIGAAREIKKRFPNVKILMLTMHKNREYLYHAIAAGAEGYLLKEDSDIELFSAIDAIRKGSIYVTRLLTGDMAGDLSNIIKGNGKASVAVLSKREKEILKLIAGGKSHREIAELLNISTRTVENHRANIVKKLSINKTAELIKYAIQLGIAEL